MKTVKLLTVTALTSSLVVATGCAGKGLKGMFSRNETAGYSTLEELDAKEAAKSKGEVADSSGPRFAPWLPFGKDKAADNTVAAAETPSATAPTDDAAKKGLFRNPFRKQETIEPDPFLNDQPAKTVADSGVKENEPEVATSKTRPATRTASMSKEVGIAGRDAGKEEMPEIAARTASRKTASSSSASSPGSAKSEETDAELVERFEKHFQKNTLEAAEDADQLIVAGKQASERKKEAVAREATAKKAPATTEADRKLAELEEILKARKGQSSERVSRAVAEETDEAGETIRQLSGRTSDQAARRTSRATRVADAAESAANRQFDQLFDAASQRMAEDNSGNARLNDVPVASADELFGRATSSGEAETRSTKPTTEKPVRSVSARRSLSEEDETQEETPAVTPSNGSSDSRGFRWQSQNLRSRSQQFLRDTAKQTAASASGLARENGLADFLPPAQAPDVPEPSPGPESAPLMIPVDSDAIASREATAVKPAGLQEDTFFAASETADMASAAENPGQTGEDSGADASVPKVSSAGTATNGILNRITMRSWLLLIGGAVVVALLYLPGRKGAASATTAQI